MSTDPEEVEEASDKPEITSPQFPKSRVQEVLHELEIMAMQKGGRSGLDVSNFDKSQIDKLLDTVAENERNAFAYHTKRIDAFKEIELKKIDASIFNQRTFKIVIIGSLLIVVPALTMLILFYKEAFFIPWLTFLTGILGGYGLSKATSGFFKQIETKNPIKEDDGE